MLHDPSLKKWRVWGVVCLGSVLSFTLNLTSLSANRATSPLTVCVAANAKQAFMIIVSDRVFGGGMKGWRGGGVWITLIGGAGYSWVSVKEVQRRRGGGE